MAALLLATGAVFLVGLDPRQWVLMRNTLRVTLGVCAVSLPVGTLLAFLLVRTDLRWRAVAAAPLGAMLFVPLYLQATAWDAGFGQLGWYSVSRDAVSSPSLSGWPAAVWIHAAAAIPWVVLIVGAGWRLIEPELEEQALLDGSPLQVLWHASRPRLSGPLVAAAVWVALSTTAEMTVTDLYRVRTYAEELYTGFALGDDWGTAWATVLPGIAAHAALILLAWLAISAVVSPRETGTRPSWTFRLRRWRWPAGLFVVSLLAVIAGVPLANLLYKAGLVAEQVGAIRVRHWSLAQFAVVLSRGVTEYRPEFGASLVISSVTATLAVALGAVIAWLARRGGRRAWPAWLLAAWGLATPGPLVGLGVIWLLNRGTPAWCGWLYSRTIVPPVLALLVRILPLAILMCWYGWRTLAEDVLDSAATDGAGRWTMFWRVAVPQRWHLLAATWVATCALAAGDLTCSILVTPPGLQTVPIRVFNLVHSGVDQQVAGLCLVTLAGYLTLAGAGWSLWRALRRAAHGSRPRC